MTDLEYLKRFDPPSYRLLKIVTRLIWLLAVADLILAIYLLVSAR